MPINIKTKDVSAIDMSFVQYCLIIQSLLHVMFIIFPTFRNSMYEIPDNNFGIHPAR